MFQKIENLSIIPRNVTVIASNSQSRDFGKAISNSNDAQLAFSKTLENYTKDLQKTESDLKTTKDQLLEIWTLADKHLKIKGDKDWNALNLNQTKTVDELHQNFKNAFEKVFYYQSSMVWLQSRFPAAKYADVVGLCKVADKTEYADEQDYSLNAGRYVGVDVEGDGLTRKEFSDNITFLKNSFQLLTDLSYQQERNLFSNLEKMNL